MCWPDGGEVLAEGVVEGASPTRLGATGGFGYDPVFVPDEGDGRTFAEMSDAEKRAVPPRPSTEGAGREVGLRLNRVSGAFTLSKRSPSAPWL